MNIEIQITPEYVRALETDQVMVPSIRFKAFSNFGEEQTNHLHDRKFYDAAGVRVFPADRFLPADRVIDHNDLVVFLARDASHLDIDLAELYALGVVSGTFFGMYNGRFPTELLLSKAITERVHQIIESRPEFLHPKLRFALKSEDYSGTWMLHFLLANRVALDADRLHAMSIGGGVGQEMLALALSPGDYIGELLIDETIYPGVGCASSAAAIIRAGYGVSRIDFLSVYAIIKICALGAAGSQRNFDQAVEITRAVEAAQDAAGGDGHRFVWSKSGQDVVDLSDFCLASVSYVHPVTAFIYQSMMCACRSRPNRAADVPGFPGVPFAIMAERLNVILEPASRLPLETLSGINALKLVTICMAADSESTVARKYWTALSGDDEDVFTLTNNPIEIIDWACQKTNEHGARLTLADLDPIQDRLAAAIGADAASEVRAKVTHRDMAATIATADHAQDAGPRRRRQVI